MAFPGLHCDESAYSTDASASLGLPAHRITLGTSKPVILCRHGGILPGSPGLPNGVMLNPLLKAAHARGCPCC